MMKNLKTDAEFIGRRRRARELLTAQKLTAAFFNDPATVRYLTGFTGGEAVLAVVGDDWRLLTDARFAIEAARCETSQVGAMIPECEISAAAAEFFARRKICKIGAEAHCLTLEMNAVFSAKKITALALAAAFAQLRAVKSAAEIAAIKRAIKVAEKAFREIRPWLREGLTELEIKAEIEYRALKNGAESLAFPTIVACGANAALPHAQAGKRRWRRGQPLLLDFGVRVDGYVSDLTRTLFLEIIPPFWAKVYDAVFFAQQAAIAVLHAGVAGRTAHWTAQKTFERDNFREFFTHGLGHGIGLEVHENPRLSARAEKPLPENCVVTVEPGLYFAGKGGVRIEDDVLITATGARILSSLEKKLDAAVIAN